MQNNHTYKLSTFSLQESINGYIFAGAVKGNGNFLWGEIIQKKTYPFESLICDSYIKTAMSMGEIQCIFGLAEKPEHQNKESALTGILHNAEWMCIPQLETPNEYYNRYTKKIQNWRVPSSYLALKQISLQN